MFELVVRVLRILDLEEFRLKLCVVQLGEVDRTCLVRILRRQPGVEAVDEHVLVDVAVGLRFLAFRHHLVDLDEVALLTVDIFRPRFEGVESDASVLELLL